jgi:hypothetical protein
MNSLTTTIATILSWLRAAVAARASARRELEPLLVMTYSYLGRSARRLDRLLANWLAGRTPRVQGERAAGSRAGARTRTQGDRPRLPTGRGWLLEVVSESRGMRSQLEHAMRQPDFALFLAEVPQAGRALRPLCRMLALEMPAAGAATGRAGSGAGFASVVSDAPVVGVGQPVSETMRFSGA